MLRTHRHVARILIACALVAGLVLAPGAIPVRAGGVVGNGTPGSCTEAAFDAALVGGGSVTFNCGPGPHTISITGQKSINLNTTIDGGSTITLDGRLITRLFDVGAVLTLRNIVLTGGYVSGDGGAIRNNSNGTLVLESSTIRDSAATGSGGAILSTGPLTITNSLLENNGADNGGALYLRFAGARTTIITSDLVNNHANSTSAGWGGAILAWDGALVTIEGSDIYSNTAQEGGGIYHFGNSVLMLRSSTWVHDNQARDSGGGIYNYTGTALLTNVTLSGNMAGDGGPFVGYGGGLYNTGTATLTNVTFNGNTAGLAGGGLYNAGTALLTNGTLSGNMAGDGGGLYNNVTATLTNVTLSGNRAAAGGGLYSETGTATLTNVTLSDNRAADGGGIYRSSGTVATRNTIVANSPDGGNCSGGVNNGDFNLSDDASCGFNTVPNLMLGPLAYNGGLMRTHMPLPGSPAINFVVTGCPPPATDQRGAPRNVGACDAGAVEYGGLLPILYLPLVVK